MPRVRMYGDRQVEHEALRGGRKQAAATALSEGAGVAEATADKWRSLSHTAGVIGRIGADVYGKMRDAELDAADQTTALEISNRYAAWRNKTLLDPKTGALATEGKDAVGQAEKVKESFEAESADIAAGLTTARSKAFFAKIKSQEWQGADLQVQRHTLTQVKKYQAQELQAHVENSINEGLQNAADPPAVERALKKATDALDTVAPGLGVGPDELALQKRGVISTVRAGVISQLLAQGKDREAGIYFAKHRGEIDGKLVDDIEKGLEEGSTRGESQRLADVIGAKGTLSEQLAEVATREGLDPKVRDMLEDRLRRKDQDRRMAEDQADKDSQIDAYNRLDQTPDVTTIPPVQWKKFEGGVRSALTEYAKKKRTPEGVETNWSSYFHLKTQAADNPAWFTATNLYAYRAKLGDTEFKEILSLQNAIKTADPKAEKDIAEFQTRTALVDATLTQHGIDPKADYNTTAGKERAQIQRMLDRRVGYLQSGGKKASNADIQAELDSILMSQTAVAGRFYGTTQKRTIALTRDDVPAAELPAITAALTRKGRAVSDESILDTYIEAQLRKGRK